MSDPIDQLGDWLNRILPLGGKPTIQSEAPGAGPEAERANLRTLHNGRIGATIPKATQALGYGGHGDPIVVAEHIDEDVQRAWERHKKQVAANALGVARKPGEIRFNQPFNLETNIQDHNEDVLGAWSLFDGTITAPGSGNSLVPIAISFATGTISPVFERLYRYPGALYILLRVSSFSFIPTGTTATGLQECYFADNGGAVCPLGIYLASSQSQANYVGIDKLLTTPYTDPGTQQVGTLFVNNIAIGGTPVTIRYQLGICYEAAVPDPAFVQRMLVPPVPAELAAALESTQAGT